MQTRPGTHPGSREKTPPARRPGGRDRKVFRILRFFSLTSLASILVAAILLTALYRHVAVRDMVRFGEQGNQMLAHSLLNAVRAPLLGYLDNEDHHHGVPPPPGMIQAIAELMRDTNVIRVKIYDDEGIVLYSTLAHQIGADRKHNPGFRGGMAGRTMSKLTYRDSFNPFDGETESDNLIQTYIPIRQASTGAILGVFEIYSDVNPLAAGIERAQMLVLGGSVLTLALLYLALLAIVRYAEHIIQEQQGTIRERSHALELLSAQLINAQEEEKQRVAVELHEGIAQTLSSIKYLVENACRTCPEGKPGTGVDSDRALGAIVPTLQDAIQEVRALAMDLRPSSLDHLGVLPTLDWYCREFRGIYPALELSQDTRIAEDEIPKPLKVVLFRLIQQMLQFIARHTSANRVRLSLGKSAGLIHLEIMDDCPLGAENASRRNDRQVHLLTLQERIGLAGGNVEITAPNAWNGTTVCASWWI